MDYALLSDEELTVRLNAMDRSAFEEIYQRYWLQLYNNSRRVLKDDDEAADVVQDVFSAMLENMGNLKFNTTLPAYLFRAANNKVINLFHRSTVKSKYIDSLMAYVNQRQEGTDALLRENQMAMLIQREIDALPPKMREVFNLSRKHYLSNKEIAERVNISETTVKKHLQVALQKLRAKLTSALFFYIMAAILWLNRLF